MHEQKPHGLAHGVKEDQKSTAERIAWIEAAQLRRRSWRRRASVRTTVFRPIRRRSAARV